MNVNYIHVQVSFITTMASKGKSPNFTELEKTILAELVRDRKDVIESKLTDGRMVEKKEEGMVLD